MNRLKMIPWALLPAFTATSLWAASMIEMLEGEALQQVYVDGARMLIKDPSGEGYMLMDLANMKSLAVNHKNKTAIDMSDTLFGAAKAGKAIELPEVDARLENMGNGPEIAGYATTHYVLYANGHKCSEIWASPKALKDSGWDALWSSHGDTMMALGRDADPHPCDVADEQAFRPEKHGMPMKEIDRNCEVSLVQRIEYSADLERTAFEVPDSYKIIKMPVMPGAADSSGPSMWTNWSGQDCSGESGTYPSEDDMEAYYEDEELMDEEYLDEEYTDEEYVDEEATDQGETVTDKFKGFMNKLKKKDKDG